MSLRQHFAAASPEARRWQGHFEKNTGFFQANIEKMGNCSEPSKISKTGINACIFKTVFEILFGGYATPTKCVAFWRLALNSLEVGSEQFGGWL